MPKQKSSKLPVTFGSRTAAAEWALRLEEIGAVLQDQAFDLAAEDVFQAADWLAAFSETN